MDEGLYLIFYSGIIIMNNCLRQGIIYLFQIGNVCIVGTIFKFDIYWVHIAASF